MDKPKPTTGFTVYKSNSFRGAFGERHFEVGMDASMRAMFVPVSMISTEQNQKHFSFFTKPSYINELAWNCIEFKFQVLHHQVILANLRQFQSKDSPALGSRELTSAAVATQP